MGGKPLVAWPILQALGVSGISRVIVSTDDEDIAAVAREYGAEVPFLRPASMARSDSLIGSAIDYTVSRLVHEHRVFVRALLILYPSSPFRSPELLREVVEILGSGKARTYTTVKPVRVVPGRWAVRQDGRLKPLQTREGCLGDTCYRSYGLVSGWSSVAGDVSSRQTFRRVVDDPIQLIDIDTIEDFRRAELVLERGLHV